MAEKNVTVTEPGTQQSRLERFALYAAFVSSIALVLDIATLVLLRDWREPSNRSNAFDLMMSNVTDTTHPDKYGHIVQQATTIGQSLLALTVVLTGLYWIEFIRRHRKQRAK